MRHRLCAALLGCLSLAAPARAADLTLSLGLDSGWSKHEMQGLGTSAAAEPHFSLITTSRDWSAELGLRGAVRLGGRQLDLGLALRHAGPETVNAANSARPWVARTGMIATAESTSALVTLRTTLARLGTGRVEGAVGLGLAATTVRLQDPGGTQTARQTVPQALIALRGVQPAGDGTEFWAEARYVTSPAVQVDFGEGRRIGHETSGWSLGIGITVPLN